MIRRAMASRGLRWMFVAVAVALAVVGLVRYWDDTRAAAGELGAGTIGIATAAALAAIGASLLAWRRLLADLGSAVPLSASARIFALAQLGKYVPGSIWPFVAQVELGREYGVPARRSAAAGLVNLGVSLVVALLIAAGTVPFVAASAARTYWWALVAAPLLLAVLHPALLNPLLDRLLRIARREPLGTRLSIGGIAGTAGWSAVSWLLYGVHVWALGRDVAGGSELSIVAATGAFTLAWSVGFLVVVAPAGAGVRELVLAAVLGSALGTGAVVVLVLASRLLITVSDLAWAGGGFLLGRRHAARVADELAEAEALRRSGSGGSHPT